jgi:hypothetical protein
VSYSYQPRLALYDTQAGSLRDLLRSRHLGRLAGLYLESYAAYGTDSTHLPELFASSHCSALTRLGLSNLAFQPADLAFLSRHLALHPLTSLRLANTDLRPGAILDLIRVMPGLQQLDLSDTWHLSDSGVREVVLCPTLARMTHLDLSGPNRVTDAAIRALAGSPYLGNLTDLGLNHTGLTDAGMDALVRSPNLPRLSLVSVFGNRVDRARWKMWQVRRAPNRWWVSWVWLQSLR